MKPRQLGIEILAVENGWVVFDHRRDYHNPGFEIPKYVFVDAELLATSVKNLLLHGTIEAPTKPEPAFTGTGLPGDPVACVKSVAETVAAHRIDSPS